MKKKILLFTAIAGIAYLSFSSYTSGPGFNGYDCTGADASSGAGNPTGCGSGAMGASCHSTAATSGITVVVELDSAGIALSSSGVGHYTPGFTYTVKITGTNTTTNNLPKFGFQVAATVGTSPAATVVNAGTLQSTGLPATLHRVIAPGTSTSFYANVVEHATPLSPATGTGGTGTTYIDSFKWTAPVAGTGTISIWGALNAVNGDNIQNASDLWNTNQLILNEFHKNTESVSSTISNISINAFPNPATNALNLQMENAAPGSYTLQVFNLNGGNLISEDMEVTGANQTTTVNTSNWPAGVYTVTVEKDGSRKSILVVKQ